MKENTLVGEDKSIWHMTRAVGEVNYVSKPLGV